MTSITLKGREVPLLYTTYEMKTIQEEIAPIGQALKIVLGRNPDDGNDMSLYGGAAHIEAASKLIRILGNAGLEEAGEAPDLTDKKVLRALKPTEIGNAIEACAKAIGEGMQSEVPDPKEESGEPVDVTLEEMKKKETKGS
jgi:hypothetical protein